MVFDVGRYTVWHDFASENQAKGATCGHLNDTQTATPEIQLLWHASSRPKTIRFNAANREELQLRCPLYSGHRNLVPPASVFSACSKNARKEALGPSSTWVTAKRRGGTNEGTVVGKHRPHAAAWCITAAALPYWSITRPRTSVLHPCSIRRDGRA